MMVNGEGMVNIMVTAYVEDFGPAGFTAWAEGFKGVRVQGVTEAEAKSELLKALRIKIAYDYKLRLKKSGGSPDLNEGADNEPTSSGTEFQLILA